MVPKSSGSLSTPTATKLTAAIGDIQAEAGKRVDCFRLRIAIEIGASTMQNRDQDFARLQILDRTTEASLLVGTTRASSPNAIEQAADVNAQHK
jgi:hypothetical protein